jgi:hypothetical protein
MAPTTLFIDTSIFDHQNYNFESAAIIPFLAAAKERSLTYLLPDPTSQEISRHIAARSDAVVEALKDARRKAPFLSKSDQLPIPSFALSWDLNQLAKQEWKSFLQNFTVLPLSLKDVDLVEVMEWYDKQSAPFGPKKKKEFPDAFALSLVLKHARENHCTVGVVSHDEDFKSACDRFVHLLYFPSLPAVTEALIAGDERVGKIKALLENDRRWLESKIREVFYDLRFFPEDDPSGTVEDIEINSLSFPEISVVAVGNTQCTVSFEVAVGFSAYVCYDDADTAIVDSSDDVFMPLFEFAGSVEVSTTLTGVAKVEVAEDWTSLLELDLLLLDQTDVPISERPQKRSKG